MPDNEDFLPPLYSLPEHLVSTPQQLTDCCRKLGLSKRFGFDTEFVGEHSYRPHLCLIQVATEECLYLIDPQTVGDLDRFWRIIIDPTNLVVVHAGREDVRLCYLSSGELPGNLFDLQTAAGLVGFKFPIGHSNLVQQVLGVRLPPAETLTEWRNRPLTPEQIRYAYDDVRFLLPLWERLSVLLDRHNRLTWAREEFERLKANSIGDPGQESTTEKWRKIRGAGTLDRRKLATLRELFVWREKRAALSNRPPRTIIRDDLLVEISRRNPHKISDLQVIRGVPKQLLSDILERVTQAQNLPKAKYPELREKDQDPNQLSLINHVLSAVLGNWCAHENLATNLVAGNHDLKLLVRSFFRNEALTEHCLLTQGWRAKQVLPLLQAVLEGRHLIRIENVGARVPLKLE